MAAPVVEAKTELVEGSTALTHTIAKPAGTVSGELLWLAVASDKADPVTLPSGFTERYNVIRGTVGGSVAIRIVAGSLATGASEPADYTYSTDDSVRTVACLRRISGADNSDPVDVLNSGGDGNSSTATCPAVTTTAADRLVLRDIGIGGGRTVTVPGGITEDYNGASGIHNGAGGHETQASAGSTGTEDFTFTGGSTNWRAATVAIKTGAATTKTATGSLDGALQEQATLSASIAAALAASDTAQASLSGVLLGALSVQTSADAAIRDTLQVTTGLQGALAFSGSLDSALGAVLGLLGTRSASFGAVISPALVATPKVEAVSNYTTTSALTNHTIGKPAGTVEGELLVFIASSDAARTITAPSGFGGGFTSSVGTVGDDASAGHIISFKSAGASEPANYTFSLNVADQAVASILRVSGADTDSPSPVDVEDGASDSNATALACAALETTGPNRLIICSVATGGATTITTPAALTEDFNLDPPGHVNQAGGHYVLANAGATDEDEFTFSPAVNAALLVVAIKPAELDGVTVTGSLDAALRKQQQLAADIGAAVQQQRSVVLAGDAALQTVASATATINAALRGLRTSDTILDAALRQMRSALSDIDAALSDEQSVLAGSDAVLADARAVTLSLAAALQRIAVLQAGLDAALSAGLTAAAGLGAALQSRKTTQLATDAVLEAQSTIVTALQGVVLRNQAIAASLDASLTDGVSTTLGADLDSAITALKVAAVAFNAAIQSTATRAAAIGAALESGNNLVASLAAVVQQEVTVSASLGGVLELLTRQAALDAALQQRRFQAAVLNAFVQSPGVVPSPRAHRTQVLADDGRAITQQADARTQRPAGGRSCVIGPDGRTIIIPASLRRN